MKAATAREHVRFRLILSSAPHVVEEEQRATLEQAAEAALWAWVMFGGVGARTRRGCGSLVCLTPDDRFRPGRNLSSWLGGAVNKHTVRGTGCPSVPGLFAQLVLGPRPVLPMAAWTLAVDAMRQFRQGIGVGRQPSGQGRQGKSNWPEAETIRAAVTRHGPAAHPAAPYFPRADLGLPIIFQQMQLGRADPTVQAAADGATRMASPIILKPLVLSEHQAFPMALRLTGPSLGEAGSPPVELVGPGGRRLTPADLQDPVKSAATPPIAATGKLSAREAFMAFAEAFWNRRAEGQR